MNALVFHRLTHCVLSHKNIEVNPGTGSLVAPNESGSMWGGFFSILLKPALQSWTSRWKGDLSIHVQNENYVATRCWPSPCPALLLVLYFGSGAAGRVDGPLIVRDTSTLSPYGARNSMELLCNLCSMFGIYCCWFSGKNSSQLTLWLLFWHTARKWHRPCSVLVFGTRTTARRKCSAHVLMRKSTPFYSVYLLHIVVATTNDSGSGTIF